MVPCDIRDDVRNQESEIFYSLNVHVNANIIGDCRLAKVCRFDDDDDIVTVKD